MYSQIAENKRRTWVLMIIMGTVVIGLTWAIGAAYGVDGYSSLIFGAIFAAVYTLTSYYVSSSVALSVAGAKPIEKAQVPELFTLVENLCIANGQTMPKVYIIEDAGPNAFATGRDPEHASIAFTTGILQLLTREELEGVAAHELSHIKNYDIRLQTIVVVLVGCIALIADLFLHLQFGRSRDREGNTLVFFLIGLALAILSPIAAQIIQLAISRQREYLADASGALLTRYPDGLARALEKISTTATPLKNANHATAHLYISNPFGAEKKPSFFNNLFSTHPPVLERVTRLRSMGR